MKRPLALIVTVLAVAILSGCSARTAAPMPSELPLGERLRNPLFAEQYGDQLVDTMVNILINESADVEKSGKKSLVEKTRQRALDLSKYARNRQKEGLIGNFVPLKEDAQGRILLLEDRIYIGPDFRTDPGPSLHLYLTTAIDPRDVKFPDPNSVDLGELRSPYGEQSFLVPKEAIEKFVFRSVVLFDARLERLYGFAQLNK